MPVQSAPSYDMLISMLVHEVGDSDNDGSVVDGTADGTEVVDGS